MDAFIISINIRKALIAALYDKVIKFSVQSIAETNSGKLISLISADMFQVERGLAFFPIIFSAIPANIFAYFLISEKIGWQYTLIIIGIWIMSLLL